VDYFGHYTVSSIHLALQHFGAEPKSRLQIAEMGHFLGSRMLILLVILA
jgi:hypothetical protein